MIDFALVFLAVWLLCVCCGLGPYLWLRTGVAHSGVAALGFSAALGLGLMGGLATFAFYLELPPWSVLVCAAAVSAGLLGAAAFFARASLVEATRSVVSGCRRDLDLLVVGGAAMGWIFAAGYEGSLGQPFRTGIDQVGYGISADFLAGGGTKSALEAAVLAQTDQASLAQALNANVTALSFNVDIASEFLLKAHRFAYPMVIAGIGQLLGFDPIVDYQFSLLAVPLFTALLLIVWLGHYLLRLPLLAAKAIALAVVFNSNQLNVLYEGQHAQIVVAPLIVLFFGLLFNERAQATNNRLCPETLRRWGLIAATGSSIFALYSDALIALGAVGVFLFCWDLLARDRAAINQCCLFGAAIVGGMIVLGPYFTNWLGFVVKHLANLGGGNGGFWQPYWATPAEIVGYRSIYEVAVASLLDRDADNQLFVVLVSGLIVITGVAGPVWRTRGELRFWLTPVVVCTYVMLDLRIINDFHNYSYMKTYTLLIVPLVVLHLASVHRWLERMNTTHPQGRLIALVGGALAALAVVYTGGKSAAQYADESRRVPAEALTLRAMSQQGELSRYAILTEAPIGIDVAGLGCYFEFNWLNLGWADLKVSSALDKEVLVLVFRTHDGYFDELRKHGDVFLDGSELLVLRTGKRVRDFDLPDVTVQADTITTSIKWPTDQAAIYAGFLRSFLRSIVDLSRPDPSAPVAP